jgi:UDP-2,3-diacylglucosamine hydrolase
VIRKKWLKSFFKGIRVSDLQTPDSAIGIIAGAGALPEKIARHLQKQNRRVFVLAYEGQTDPCWLDASKNPEFSVHHQWCHLGRFGTALDLLKEQGITTVTMAGYFKRPDLRSLKVDWLGAKFLGRIGLRWAGDDSILREIEKSLKEYGIGVIAPQELMKELTFAPPEEEAPLGKIVPTDSQWADIRLGQRLLGALSPFDFGQGVGIYEGIVLGVEACEGTDACIQRCGQLRGLLGIQAPLEDLENISCSMPLAIQGGVYIKCPKIQQSHRLDLPAIGLKTLETLKNAGFHGLAIQSQNTILLDGPELFLQADALGLFIANIGSPLKIPQGKKPC